MKLEFLDSKFHIRMWYFWEELVLEAHFPSFPTPGFILDHKELLTHTGTLDLVHTNPAKRPSLSIKRILPGKRHRLGVSLCCLNRESLGPEYPEYG